IQTDLYAAQWTSVQPQFGKGSERAGCLQLKQSAAARNTRSEKCRGSILRHHLLLSTVIHAVSPGKWCTHGEHFFAQRRKSIDQWTGIEDFITLTLRITDDNLSGIRGNSLQQRCRHTQFTPGTG